MQKQQKKTQERKKRKRRRRDGDAAQARPGRVDPGWRATQVAVRPRLARDLGHSATQASCDPCFCFWVFFFFSSLMNTYFLLLWFSFAIVVAVSFVFYFNCKSSLRDSISMQMPRGKSATSDVNNPSKSSLKNSIYRP